MINKLRRKFIIIAISSVAVVLFIIVGSINIANYVRMSRTSDKIITVLANNKGAFPERPFEPDKWNGITPETPFETRFFTAMINESGEIIALDLKRIAALSEEEVTNYVNKVQSSKKNNGMYKDFKFTATNTDFGKMYVFLDCGRDMSIFRNFLLTSFLISIGSLIVVSVLIIILSKFVLKPIEESYTKQKCFITNAGHDIKTPLTIINAETDIIDIEYGENEYTKEIKKQVSSLNKLTQKLIFLSRMEEFPKLEMCDFDLSKTLRDTIVPYEQTAVAKKCYSFSVAIEENIVYFGNEELIRQMTALLLDNAIKYTKLGGNIDIKLFKSDKQIKMIFSNDVEYMETGKHDELFERFYRADKSRNSEKSGNGIGLSVVKAIVEQLKGKITAESADGKSIAFTVII